eukprot:gene8147-9018_t
MAPPHELFSKSKHGHQDGGDKEEYGARTSEDKRDNQLLQQKIMELNSLNQKFIECSEKKDQLFKELVKKTMNDTAINHELPYLRQIFRALLATLNEGEHAKIILLVDHKNRRAFLECINEERNIQSCVDSVKDIFNATYLIKPPKMLELTFGFLEKITLGHIVSLLYGSAVALVCLYTTKMILSRNSVLGIIVILILVCFVVSIPWEWMRMYKKALAKKARDSHMNSDCINSTLSMIGLAKWWLQDTFSFSDSQCSKYYDALLVDPHWEVTPGQAITATFSRMFLEPFLHIAEYTGKCFRLIFKEVPLQWQPFLLIAIFVIILFSIGIQIYTPLLRIGRGTDNHANHREIIATQRERIAALEGENDRLNRRLEALAAPVEQAVEPPDIHQARNGAQHQVLPNDYVLVNRVLVNNAVEELPQNVQRMVEKQPSESVDNGDNKILPDNLPEDC